MKMNSSKFKEKVKKNLQKIRLRYLANKDINRFSKSAAFSLYDESFEQLSSRIMYNVHALEKGMSHTENLRLGFGKKALATLNDALVLYEKNNYDINLYPYIEGRSIILRYKEFHEKKDFDLSFIEKIVNEVYLEQNKLYKSAGTKIIYAKDKLKNHEKNFYDLAQNRSSIREFSGKAVDKEKIIRAIKNSEKTPSVCNRQGWKVYIVETKEIIEKLLFLQRGFKGYPNLPEFVLAITVSNSTFLSPVERNEAFIDGGLFSMSLIYGLEYEGLAAVTLNAMMNSNDETAIRKLISVNESEQLILFIAIGAIKEETIVPISDRKSYKEFVKTI